MATGRVNVGGGGLRIKSKTTQRVFMTSTQGNVMVTFDKLYSKENTIITVSSSSTGRNQNYASILVDPIIDNLGRFINVSVKRETTGAENNVLVTVIEFEGFKNIEMVRNVELNAQGETKIIELEKIKSENVLIFQSCLSHTYNDTNTATIFEYQVKMNTDTKKAQLELKSSNTSSSSYNYAKITFYIVEF